MSNIYQIKRVDKNTQNFRLKYKVFDFIGNDYEMNCQDSFYLEKKGKEFVKIKGNSFLTAEDVASLLNDYFNNYMPNKQLILTKNIYV